MGASIERDMFKNIFEWGDTLQCEGHLSRVRLTPSLKGKEKKGTLTNTETEIDISPEKGTSVDGAPH